MLARHAENLFWAGRYLERAEDTARMLDVTYHSLLEAAPGESDRSWEALLDVLGLGGEFRASGWGASARSVTDFLVLDDRNSGSILSSIVRARENLHGVRELVTTELWEAANELHHALRSPRARLDLDQQPYVLYGAVRRGCQLLCGVASETMPRDEGWRFLQLGWMLERTEMTARLVSVRYGAEWDDRVRSFQHWTTTLRSASALEPYRRVYRSSLDPAHVVEFLLLSPTFPRSVLFCLRRIAADLARIAESDALSRPQRLVGRLVADLAFRTIEDVLDEGLASTVLAVQRAVVQIGEAVAIQHFRNSQEQALSVLDFRPAGALET